MLEQKKITIPQQTSAHHDSHESDEIDLLELLRTIWRGKFLILIVTLAALIVGFLYAFVLAVPMYSASTTLALEVRDQQLVDLESVMSGVSTESEAMNTELEVIRSRGLLENVVQVLDLTDDPEFNPDLRPDPLIPVGAILKQLQILLGQPPHEDMPEPNHELNVAVDILREAISASVQRNTYVFNITVTTQNPRKSMRIVNTLAELYIDNQVQVKFNATENAVAWLSERVVELESELQEREDAINAKQAGSDFVSVEGLESLNQFRMCPRTL
ncbi:Wzz/FepE/Etk N-terminal domain-containing protein, partial [Marivita sp. GX14005]|uniref:GumC family protein n=1 Tax=Marivita sp. GX14005 TaxID=2942276 RepID=UPI0020190CBC